MLRVLGWLVKVAGLAVLAAALLWVLLLLLSPILAVALYG